MHSTRRVQPATVIVWYSSCKPHGLPTNRATRTCLSHQRVITTISFCWLVTVAYIDPPLLSLQPRHWSPSACTIICVLDNISSRIRRHDSISILQIQNLLSSSFLATQFSTKVLKFWRFYTWSVPCYHCNECTYRQTLFTNWYGRDPTAVTKFQGELHQRGTRKWEKFAIFDRNPRLSRKRYEIGSWLLWITYRKS